MAASEAVRAAIDELEAERERLDTAIAALKRFAGEHNGANAPKVAGPFPCDQCKRVFKAKQGLQVHKARAH